MHLSELLNSINTWAQGIISSLGYPGLGMVMFLENLFPPLPSEIILPLAGWLTLEGRFTIVGVTVVGAIGSVAGALFFYGLGHWFDEARIRWLLVRYGKWLMLTTEDLDRALAWFGRYGEYVIFFGRMIPIVRSLISIPAGLANMNLGRFCLYTSVGTALWSFLLAFAGRLLGKNWSAVSEWIGHYEDVVLVVGILAVLAFFGHRLWQHLRQRRANA